MTFSLQVPPPLHFILATSSALAADVSEVAPALVTLVLGLEELPVELDLVAEVAALRGRGGRRALVVDTTFQETVRAPEIENAEIYHVQQLIIRILVTS